MNPQQLNMAIRWAFATFGPFITSHGYASSSTLEMLSGVAVSLVPLILGFISHTEANAVAAVADIAKRPDSPVKAVITENSMAGREMARNIQGPVEPAGTAAATTLAALTPPL